MPEMPCSQFIWFFLILALLWSSVISSQGSPYLGNMDADGSLQWAGCEEIAPYWQVPLIFVECNNPPETPTTPAGAANGVPAESYSFSTFAVDPDGDNVMYTLDWADGTQSCTSLINSGEAATVNHTWSRAGTYRIRAMATDSKKANSLWSKALYITINTPPSKPKKPSGPTSGRPGVSINYTVSSVDPDKDQMRYTLDWGDGTQSITGFLDTGAFACMNHTWNRSGTYQIKANAIDEGGAESAWSLPQTVIINSPPDKPLKPSGPVSVYAWAAYAYTSSASDPDGDQADYTFDWGDGNTSRTGFISSGGNATAVHRWSHEGCYRIIVTARDRQGEASKRSVNLTVRVIANERPHEPRSLFGQGFGYTGIAHSYFTMAKDDDGDGVMYSFDWADKTASTTDMVDSGSVECANHTWIKAGRYQIKAKATDSKGASSEWTDIMMVNISDNDPPYAPIAPSGPTSGRSKTSYRYATSANDPNGDPVKYVFDWGDRTTSWTGLEFIDSGKRQSVSHKWSTSGTYQVKAMALDDKGASSGWSNSLVINIFQD